jgi:CRISPR-associated protein Csa3
MNTYLSPIGYDSTRVTRPVLSEGIDKGDQVILLRPAGNENDDRAMEAIEDVKRIINQIHPDVNVTKCMIPIGSSQVAVLECSELIINLDGKLVVNFGGGPRELYLPLVTATLAHPDSVDKTLQFNDLDGSVGEILLPRITGDIPDSAADTLDTIVENQSGIGIPELTKELNTAKSTVSRHIRQLEKADAVTAEMHGKTKYVKPTFSGKLRSQMKSVYKT